MKEKYEKPMNCMEKELDFLKWNKMIQLDKMF